MQSATHFRQKIGPEDDCRGHVFGLIFKETPTFSIDEERPVALPSLTPEQRQAALEKAAAARAARAAMKVRLKSGSVKLSDLLDEAEADEALAKMRVVSLLEAMPGVGRATARQIIDQVGISEARRVRGLGPNQRKALIERFG